MNATVYIALSYILGQKINVNTNRTCSNACIIYYDYSSSRKNFKRDKCHLEVDTPFEPVPKNAPRTTKSAVSAIAPSFR